MAWLILIQLCGIAAIVVTMNRKVDAATPATDPVDLAEAQRCLEVALASGPCPTLPECLTRCLVAEPKSLDVELSLR